MITQRVKLDVNNQQGPTIYARMGEKNLRQIVFILTRKDEESGEDVSVDIPSGAVGQLRILKPSNNFVIVDLVKTTLESGSVIFTATLPEQAVTVGGLCYYDVRIEETTSKFIFSVTGHMVVDDAVISSGVLEDVSEVNGLVFPDDFLTTDDNIAQIDDSMISSAKVWSSYKTNTEIRNQIEAAIEDLPSPMTNYSTTPVQVGTWLDGITPVYERVITEYFGEYVTAKNIPFSSSNNQNIIDFRVYVKPSDANDGLIPAFPSMGYSGNVEAGAGGSLYGTTGVTVTRTGGTAYGNNPQIIIIYKYYPKEGD